MIDIFLNLFFSQYTLILLIFYFGFDLYKEGNNRINTRGNSVNYNIPDQDIINMMHDADKFNLKSGFWYKIYIGPFFMIYSILIACLIIFFQKNLPDIRNDISLEFKIFISFQLILFFLTNTVSEITEDGYEKMRNGIMFRMDLYKKSIINLYKSIDYISIHGDMKNIDKYKQETCRYLKKLPIYFKYICVGFYLWYINLVLFMLFVIVKMLFG